MLPWVFDVDGVLCDTRQAVYEAYKAVGVDSDQAQGRPVDAWLNDEAAHAKKNALYPTYLSLYGQRSAICDFVAELQQFQLAFVAVLSAASSSAIATVLRFVGLPGIPILAAGCTADEKVEALKNLAPQGFYVDDRVVTVPKGWNLLVSSQWTL